MGNYNHKDVSIFDVKMMGLEGFCGIFIIKGTKNVLIDAGTAECSGELISHLKRTGITPDYIVITHNHYDHIGALSALKKEFTSMKIITGECGRDRLKNPNEINSLFTDVIFEPVEDVIVFGDGEILDTGDRKLQIIYTPGHSDDSISIYDSAAKLIFPGDLPGDWLWNSTYLSPHITPDFSEKKYIESTEKILSLDIECSALAHFGFFTGRDAKGIYISQMERYNTWKDELITAWSANRDTNDLVPVLKNFFKGSPFEQNPGYDAVMSVFAQWCVMGYKASGLIF